MAVIAIWSGSVTFVSQNLVLSKPNTDDHDEFDYEWKCKHIDLELIDME